MSNSSSYPAKILFVGGDQNIYHQICRFLDESNSSDCEIAWKTSLAETLLAIQSNLYDLYLIDFALGVSANNFDALRDVEGLSCQAPIILLLENETQASDFEIAEFNAFDYLFKKDLDAARFEFIVRAALKREHAFRTLRESEAKYRNFIEKLPVMFYAVEPAPPYAPIYISPEFELFGYPLEQWRSSKNMRLNVLHPEDRDRVLRETDAAMSAGRETDFEYRIIAQDETVRWVSDRGRFVTNENGEIICWQGVILDITDHKRAEENLRESEKRYRQMFEKNRAIKLLIDASSGAIVDANPAACDFYGYSSEQFKTKKITDLNTLSPEQILREMKKAVTEKRNYFTFRHRLASGKVRDVEVHSSPLNGQNGKLLYSIIYDVTERARAEEALKESEARFRDIFENANDIIYTHDLAGNYTSINKAAERVFGYTRDEALKMNLEQIVAPESLETARRNLKDKLSGSRQAVYEVNCVTKDGRKITLEINSRGIYKNGKVAAVQGIARDITERKQTELALKESEIRYRELFENANDLIYTHDLAGNFTSLNRAGEKITGYTRDEAMRLNIAQVVAPEYLNTARGMISRKVERDAPTIYELEIIAKEGHRVTLELSTRLICENGKPVGVQGIARDITARKRAEESLIESERSYRFLSEGIMHQVWTALPNGELNYVNRRTLDYFGMTAEQMLGEGWQNVVHPEDLPGCIKKWSHSLQTGEYYEVEFRLKSSSGAYRWHLARAIAARDSDGKIINWFGTNTDIDDKKTAEAQLSHFAQHDTLTTLPNRAAFMNYLTQANVRANGDPDFRFAVLFLDLDRFKIINDGLGHIIGDKLLVAIAERLKTCIRPGDVVARLGGDEFTILLHNVKETAAAIHIAERVQRELSLPFKLDNYEVFTSVSIGIIVSDNVCRQPEDFLRDADTAMYRAKESGKARYEIFDSEMHVRNMTLLQIENDLRRAVERNEFRVFYQPIVSLRTGQIQEFEALVRWQHPEHGLIAPDQFISVAEETGLIVPIGKWILREACRQTREWQRYLASNSERRLSISVNLSAKQLMNPALIGQINEVLAESELDARFLKLEVTESMVMEHSEMALGVLSELRALGISLSTDDFGTGYSSLSYLHRFPFNRLKIDRSFINKMDSDSKSCEIVRTILMLAEGLNMEVVAEGIETEGHLDLLRRLGCRLGQGFFYSKPVEAQTAARMLREGLQKTASIFARDDSLVFDETLQFSET
jgi:diguanylate cyclase (GGDEF)-like protein/PAS domain S-box-containing protein